MIDEYKSRDLNKRFQLMLVRNREIPLNSWEISNTLNLLTSYYYKVELINSISFALNENISAENIFILTESFSLNNLYEKMDTLDIPNQLYYLFQIGAPISLLPNKKLFLLNLLFKSIKEIREILRSARPKLSTPFKIKDILPVTYNLVDDNYESVGKHLSDLANQIINSSEIKSKKKSSNYDTLRNNIDGVIKKYIRLYDNYLKNEVQINLFKKFISGLEIDIKEIHNIEGIESQYFNQFQYYFTKVSRPVVGIFYEDENRIAILGKSHINKKKRDNLFFDTKEITKVNPLKFLVEASLALGQLSIEKERLKLDKEKHELEMKKLKKENEILRLQKLREEIKLYNEMEVLIKEQGLNEVNEIKNTYLKQKILTSKARIFSSYSNLLDKNNLEIDKERTQILDLKA